MEDPPLERDGDAEPQRESDAGMPRWVKLFGLVALILALALVVMFLVVGGDHGPGRHAVGGSAAQPEMAADRPPGGAPPPARGCALA